MNPSTPTVTARPRGKTESNCLPSGTPPEPYPTQKPTPPPTFPYDIVEMVVAYLIYDLGTLKACSLICRSWYTAVIPHLYHTLTLQGVGRSTNRSRLKPLSKLHELGLIPFVKEVRIDQGFGSCCWFLPREINHHFSALANVRILKLDNIDIDRFIPDIEHHFGHFSSTLRSITLHDPRCSPRHLSHFLSLFSNLDDIEIQGMFTPVPHTTVPDTELVPFSAPKLRGRLVLRRISCVEAWTRLISSCGGLRFRHMGLDESPTCAPLLLDACAKSLEILRFDANDGSLSELFYAGLFTSLS